MCFCFLTSPDSWGKGANAPYRTITLKRPPLDGGYVLLLLIQKQKSDVKTKLCISGNAAHCDTVQVLKVNMGHSYMVYKHFQMIKLHQRLMIRQYCMNTNQEDSPRLGSIQHCTTQNRLSPSRRRHFLCEQIHNSWIYRRGVICKTYCTVKRTQSTLHTRLGHSILPKIKHLITVTVTAVH